VEKPYFIKPQEGFLMEQTGERAGQLLNGVTDIIRDYEARRQKTGEKSGQTDTPEFRDKGVLV
jgi:hypothetical protein